MTDAQRADIRVLISELAAFAQRRETDIHLLNPKVARRVRARISELELMLAEDEGGEMGARGFAQTIGESRALMEDEPGPPVDGRIPPEDSGPVRLRSSPPEPEAVAESGVRAALARRARAALDDD